jgi:GAF domain-containing protein
MNEGHRLLSDVLAEVASLSAEPFDVAELVHLASTRACEVLSCDGAVVLLTLDGEALGSAGGSSGLDGIGSMLDLHDTPCHEAMRTGDPVVFTGDDDCRSRYAEFAELAEKKGMRGVLSVPLKHKGQLIGTLCLIRQSRRHFLSHTVSDAQRLADVIAASIVREQAHRAALAVTAQLQHALEARVVVEQAKGMVAAELDISVDEALELVRHFARRQHLRMVDVAGDIVRRKLAVGLLSP